MLKMNLQLSENKIDDTDLSGSQICLEISDKEIQIFHLNFIPIPIDVKYLKKVNKNYDKQEIYYLLIQKFGKDSRTLLAPKVLPNIPSGLATHFESFGDNIKVSDIYVNCEKKQCEQECENKEKKEQEILILFYTSNEENPNTLVLPEHFPSVEGEFTCVKIYLSKSEIETFDITLENFDKFVPPKLHQEPLDLTKESSDGEINILNLSGKTDFTTKENIPAVNFNKCGAFIPYKPFKPVYKNEMPIDYSLNLSNIIANHYNLQENEGLTKRNASRIVYMRNFNNWIKSALIRQYTMKAASNSRHGGHLKVLDLCCGRGGDIMKWKTGNISYVIFVDIAKDSVERCRNRYRSINNLKYTPEFITCDCTKERLRDKYKDPRIQFDIVSCQFAFHYCFASLPQAECMFRNASECLKSGGYFIGTIPNADELVSRWRKSKSDEFGNDVYSVKFECNKEKPPLFGAKYHFKLENSVNCPEFLVHPKTFKKLGLKFGLELRMFEPFSNYYKYAIKERENMYVLNNMNALETYPPSHSDKSRGNYKTDYSHAYQHLNDHSSNKSRNIRIGTLSKSEWEAITIYAAFAFQKL